MYKIRTTVLLFFMFLALKMTAQFDSILIEYQKQFDAFKSNIEQEHGHFKNSNDSIFANFLKDSWEKFSVYYSPAPEEVPKPQEQPEFYNDEQKDTLKLPVENIPEEIEQGNNGKQQGKIDKNEKGEVARLKKNEPPIYERSGEIATSVEYYGTEAKLSLPSSLPHIKNISSDDISRFFTTLTRQYSFTDMLNQLSTLKSELNLNDWGYMKLLEAVAKKNYATENEQKLFLWVMMLNNGYNAKLGFSKSKIYLLFPANEKVYSSWFITINNNNYYLINDKTENNSFPELNVHKADYPEAKSLSLALYSLPKLTENPQQKELMFNGEKIQVNYCKNLIDFFASYPVCNAGVYFLVPMSGLVEKSLNSYFTPLFAGLTQGEKVELLLRFTQTAFPYKTDQEQFGREKIFFPEEIFHYPYSDCDDRSVFFCNLVKHFTGLSCIGLDFPGHINSAVALPDWSKGTCITHNNTCYYVCDPTYINAPIGLLPDDFAEQQPKIIIFDE